MPVTPTYVPLATIELTAGETSVSFSSIPATYRDLILVMNLDGNSANLRARANADTGSNYSRMGMFFDGSVGSFANTNDSFAFLIGGLDSGAGNLLIAQFMDYSATDKHKTVLARSGSMPLSEMGAYANRWANTAAINQIEIYATSGSWDSGRFSLYGIA